MEVRERASVEIDFDALVIAPPGARSFRIRLASCHIETRDAVLSKRFVRHLRLQSSLGSYDFVTPPEEGTIAPRCAQLPPAPSSALVLPRDRFDVALEWMTGGGRVGGRTVSELARLASVATSTYAVHLGERAAQVAVEMAADVCGPMRGCRSPRMVLSPLIDAARTSERAGEALVAALAKSALLVAD